MDKVKKILSDYPNKNTKRNLKRAILDFFISIYGEAKRKQLDELAEKYFNEERDHERDVETFQKYLNGQAPLTVKLKISNVKTFLMENDIELSHKFWRKIGRRIKGSRALTLDKVPSNEELRKILSHMPIHGKAVSLLLSSSGIRIGEALGLCLDDLLLDEEPVRIQIRGEITKTGNSRYAFASNEAKEAINEWLKVRKDYLEAASGKSHKHKKSAKDDKLFPFGSSTLYMLWNGALEKTRLDQRDKSTNRNKVHPHVLHKFFRTRLGAVIPVDVVEALMGHEGYLTEVYRKYSLEDLGKFYLKGEAALLVFTDTQKVVELHKAIEEKNTQLQVLVNSLASENQNMKGKISAMEDRMKRLSNVEVENLEIKSKVARIELENTEAKKEMQELSLTVKSLVEKLEKLTED